SQRLVTLSFHLDAVRPFLDRDEAGAARADLATACDLVLTPLGEARTAIGALRPPVLDDLGLAGALAALARGLPGVRAVLDLDERRLPEHVEVALYRIAQETLQNVLKHADAREVTVRLATREHGVRLELADDGVGFDPSRRAGTGHGLASVRERAELVGGSVRVTSRPGTGTTVAVTAPLDSSSNGEESASNT
ncbi:MAG TPA: ATP-binding protein, partial [Actinomycetospora sp.]|nr:ATP-binding protein [Actinomycetospora sp.]